MKTLKELNSKWYWRFMKVICFSLLFIVMASCILVYKEMKTYNPEIFKIYDTENKTNFERIAGLRIKYPNMIISQKEIKENHTPANDLASLFRMGKEIEGQSIFGNGQYNKEKCTAVFRGYLEELNRDGEVTYFSVDASSCGINDANEFDKFFEKGYNYFNPKTDIETRASIYQDLTGEYIYRDYLGFWGIVKTIFYVLGLWMGILILAFGVKCIIYYIIFGKVFPPK